MDGAKSTIVSCLIIIGTIWGLIASWMVAQAIWNIDTAWTPMALSIGVGITMASATIMGCILGFMWLDDKSRKERYYGKLKNDIVASVDKMTAIELEKMRDHIFQVKNEAVKQLEGEIEERQATLNKVKDSKYV